jgi:hypothetical protein
MGTGVDADRGTGSAAKAREPGVALLFRRASALALVGMAAFSCPTHNRERTDIVITRRRAGWPVRRVSVRSRITRQSPAYAPFVAFADVSVAPPTIASADTASRIRFITVSTPIGETRFCYRNFKFPELLRNHFAQAPSKSLMSFYFCQIFQDWLALARPISQPTQTNNCNGAPAPRRSRW